MVLQRRRGWLVLAAGLVIGGATAGPVTATAAAGPAADQAAAASCSYPAGTFDAGPVIDPPITLTPDAPSMTVNVGADRSVRSVDVVLRASRPLPATVQPAQFDLDVVRRLTRQDDGAATVTTTPFTFSKPRFNPRRDVVQFSMCLDPARVPAGHYAGAISVEGPDGVGPTTIAVTANAKNGTLFWWTFVLASLSVLLLLVWRAMRGLQADHAKDVAHAVLGAPDAGAPGGGAMPMTEEVRTKAVKAVCAPVWASAREVLVDPLFWTSTVPAFALAVTAAWALYQRDTAWGTDPVRDAIALVSAVLSAAGLRSLIATSVGK